MVEVGTGIESQKVVTINLAKIVLILDSKSYIQCVCGVFVLQRQPGVGEMSRISHT